MKRKIPKTNWHHGDCEMCGIKNTLILHFNYNTQVNKDFKICLKCLEENSKNILYSWMKYKVDKTINEFNQ